MHVIYTGEDGLPLQQDTEMCCQISRHHLLYDMQCVYLDIACVHALG